MLPLSRHVETQYFYFTYYSHVITLLPLFHVSRLHCWPKSGITQNHGNVFVLYLNTIFFTLSNKKDRGNQHFFLSPATEIKPSAKRIFQTAKSWLIIDGNFINQLKRLIILCGKTIKLPVTLTTNLFPQMHSGGHAWTASEKLTKKLESCLGR